MVSPESFWILVAWLAGLTTIIIFVVRLVQHDQDHERRQLSRKAWEEREAERDKERFLEDIDRYFPFVRAAVSKQVAAGHGAYQALVAALKETPGVRIGTTFYDLPAVLPLAERRKHLYVVGKTGMGKTSLLLNIIREDLEQGRGVGVIAPEAELFRDWLLPLVPENRVDDVIYFAPGNTNNSLTFNPLAIEPGDDQGRAAGELFAIFKRAIGDEGLGARMGPIVGNAFAMLTGRGGATLWDVKRLLEDAGYRRGIAADTDDQYLREFWLRTYESYPKGSHLPVINRLDQFLRPIPLRRALTHPTSSFSIRTCLANSQILFLDLSQLAPDAMLLLGQMLLSKFQIELMRRETMSAAERLPFYLVADEFETFSSAAESTWRDCLSRGRKYGLALALANQFPSQVPQALRDEIFGNVSSIVALSLGSKDAQAVRREFLEPPANGGPAQPISAAAFVGLKTGEAVCRLGGGALALRVSCTLPLAQPDREWGEVVRETSWRIFGSKPAPDPTPPPASGTTGSTETIPDSVIEDEVID